ncbi:MAG TPA: hypothetical protein VMR81_00700 [Patescibacteria group bacterium]|jgi:hypothetical protein|nr:hypothetical protein [Patescibacteria group bacterium]
MVEVTPKSLEDTRKEKFTLALTHRYIYYHWENSKGSLGIPTELTEQFALVWGDYTGNQSHKAREAHFEFLSNYGSFNLNMWVVDKERKQIFVNADLYTLGLSGEIRGKGKDGLHGIHRTLQSLSNASGYTIFHIATPNEVSAPLFTAAEGYRPFTTSDRKLLGKDLDKFSKSRWNRLMRTATSSPSKIKQYDPSQTDLHLLPREQQEIDTMLPLVFLK